MLSDPSYGGSERYLIVDARDVDDQYTWPEELMISWEDAHGYMPEDISARFGFFTGYSITGSAGFQYDRSYLVTAYDHGWLTIDIGIPENASSVSLAPMFNFYQKQIPLPDYGIRLYLDFGVGPCINLNSEGINCGIMFTFGTIKY